MMDSLDAFAILVNAKNISNHTFLQANLYPKAEHSHLRKSLDSATITKSNIYIDLICLSNLTGRLEFRWTIN